MNKKFLSAILFGVLMASSGTFVSCKDYDDDIDGLADRIDAIESLSSELKSQIQKGAVITEAVSTDNGLAITLSNGNTFEITNGIDGAPGTVIKIGEDGYWYIDGVKTEYKAQGEKGDKGDKGDQGDKGDKGDQGEPGVAGSNAGSTYYYPGTTAEEDGYWVKVTVAEDGTETKTVTDVQWIASFNTTGVTAVWSNNALILRNVEGTDNDVVISLNAALKALIFMPEMVLDGQNAMEYKYIPYKAFNVNGTTSSQMMVHQIQTATGYETREEKFTVSSVDVQVNDWTFLNPTYNKEYHMDPTTAVISEFTQNNLGVVSGDKDFIVTRGNNAAAKPMAVWFQDVVNGRMQVGITMAGQKVKTQEEEDRYDLGIFYPAESDDAMITDLAIQAPLDAAKTEIITSTYAAVYASQIAVEAIAYNTSTYANSYIITENSKDAFTGDNFVGAADVHDNAAGTEKDGESGRHLYKDVFDAASKAATVEIAYNNAAGINLNDLVTTHVGANSARSWNTQATYSWSKADVKAHGMKYVFDRINFTIGDNETEQSNNHAIIQEKNGESYIIPCGVKSNSDVEVGKCEPDMDLLASAVSSVGRTPLVRVILKDTINNKNVMVGYIKFKIVAPENPLETKPFDLGQYFYSCGESVKNITWHAIESKLLEATRNTSKETFDATYEIVANEAGDVAQWTKTAKTDVNGKPIYELTTELGVIKHLTDDGAETTNVFSWTLDRADFVQSYHANEAAYPVITETRYVKYAPKKYLGNSNFNVEPVYLPITITLNYPKAVMGNKISKYWYADNSMNDSDEVLPVEQRKNLHANIEVPNTTTDEKVANADIRFSLDSRFELNVTGHSDKGPWYSGYTGGWEPGDICWATNENAPTFKIVPEAWDAAYAWNTEANFQTFKESELVYYYYFTLGNNGRKVTGVSGTQYTLSVANIIPNDPVMLYSDEPSYEYKNVSLLANGVEIANLEYNLASGHTRKHGVWLNLVNCEAAKDLLNLPKEWKAEYTDQAAAKTLLEATLDVNIGVAVFNKTCGAYMPLKDNTFNAEILKPVYEEAKGPVQYIDAHDGETQMTEVWLADLVSFYDWRQFDFANHLDYYNYYQVTDIIVNPKEIETDITGTMRPLKDTSLDVEFHMFRNNVKVDDGYVTTRQNAAPAASANWAAIQAHYGKLTYTNNTGTVVNFKIRIPVRITHKWSHESLIVWVEGQVGRTEAN